MKPVHWQLEERDNYTLLTLDVAGQSANVLSRAVLGCGRHTGAARFLRRRPPRLLLLLLLLPDLGPKERDDSKPKPLSWLMCACVSLAFLSPFWNFLYSLRCL